MRDCKCVRAARAREKASASHSQPSGEASQTFDIRSLARSFCSLKHSCKIQMDWTTSEPAGSDRSRGAHLITPRLEVWIHFALGVCLCVAAPFWKGRARRRLASFAATSCARELEPDGRERRKHFSFGFRAHLFDWRQLVTLACRRSESLAALASRPCERRAMAAFAPPVRLELSASLVGRLKLKPRLALTGRERI